MHLRGQAASSSSTGSAGFAMAALLVAIGVLSVVMLVALPTWRQQAQREKEAELIFRGEQYARAIALYQRKVAGAFPPNLDVLVEQKFLRKKYKDPITGEDFVPVYASALQAGQQGTGDPSQPGALAPLGGFGQQTPQQGGAPRTSTAAGPGGVGSAQTPGGQTSTSPFGQSSPQGSPIPATTGIVGVTSASTERTIRLYNGRSRYDQWIFLYNQPPSSLGAIAPAGTVPVQTVPPPATPPQGGQ